MRYFIFSAIYKLNTKMCFYTFGAGWTLFPSQIILKNKILEMVAGARDIAILSISEVSEDDYKTFFGISDETTQAQK